MSIVTVFYLISLLGNLSVFSAIILVALIIMIIIVSISAAVTYDADGDLPINHIKLLKIIAPSIFLVGLFNCLIPSTLTMYSMVGVKYLSDSQIPEKVAKLINLKLDEFIDIQTKDKK